MMGHSCSLQSSDFRRICMYSPFGRVGEKNARNFLRALREITSFLIVNALDMFFDEGIVERSFLLFTNLVIYIVYDLCIRNTSVLDYNSGRILAAINYELYSYSSPGVIVPNKCYVAVVVGPSVVFISTAFKSVIY